MNRYILTTFLLTLTTFLNAQTTLPYYSGFDSPSQKAGWVEYKKAGVTTGGWEYKTLLPYSGSECLYQIYSTSHDVDNWMVSPPFSLTGGGTLDSIRYMFNGFETPYANDTIAVYLLNGSPDPDIATKTLLFDFRNGDFVNDGVYRKLNATSLSAGAGSSYIAIRFKCEQWHWLECRFENIAVSGSGTTGIDNAPESRFSVYPNPVTDMVTISGNSAAVGIIYDASGKAVASFNVSAGQNAPIDLSAHPSGLYILELQNSNSVKRIKIVKE